MKIYFLILNQYSVLPMLFFRMIGYKVYFLDCGQRWKKKSLLIDLTGVGLIWLNYQENGGARSAGIGRDLVAHSMRIGRQIFALESFQRLVDVLGRDAAPQTSIYQRVFSDIYGPIELIHFMQHCVLGTTKTKSRVWIPNTIITRGLLDVYPNISNLCPRAWTVFETVFDLGGRVVGRLFAITSRSINHFFNGSKGAAVNDQFPLQSDTSSLQDLEVAYFPHQGIYYGKLFLKDHFYSSESGSPFFHEKIGHFELNGNKYLSPTCLDYYQAKNIQNNDWQALPFNKRSAVKGLIQFLGKALRHGFSGLDVDLLVKQAIIVWSIQVSMLRLQHLPNLKIVLIGYDILFPQPLSAACKLSGVKTVAVQERMLGPWWMPPMLIDHYFVIGQEALDYLWLHAPLKTTFHELGPVRLKDHAKARIPNIVSSIREKYSWIVLAMDYHSEVGWFENGRCIANNWRTNMIFYDHLLKLCNDFPNAFFLLKGKNTDFTQIPFFEERVSQFRSQPNLLILEDQEQWTPFSSVAAADIAVVRQTSLADEMLALGKPVIFDDYDGFPSEIYDYGSEVIAYDYDDIKGKLTRFFADPEVYNENLNGLRNKLYSIPAEPVEQIIQKELVAIWHEKLPCGIRK